MAQLARCLTELARSAGTWQLTSGTDLCAMINETLADNTASVFQTPNTTATHTCTLKLGANWNGTPLARPRVNTPCILQIHVRGVTGATPLTVTLVEGATNNVDGTTRDTWNVGSLAANAWYTEFRRLLSGAVVDSITDFTNLSLRFAFTVTNPNRGSVTYASLRMPDVSQPTLGLISTDFTGLTLTTIPRYWEYHNTNIQVAVGAPIVNGAAGMNGAVGSESLWECHAQDFQADCYAKVRVHSTFNGANLGQAVAIRGNPSWVSYTIDSQHYELANDFTNSKHTLSYDGVVPDDTIATALYGDNPPATSALLAGESYEEGMIGTALYGKHQGSPILSATDARISAGGINGFVLVARVLNTDLLGASYFEMGSIPTSRQGLCALTNIVDGLTVIA